MVKKHTRYLKSLMNAPIFRLYCAIVWRYLVWLFALNILGSLFFILMDLLLFRLGLPDLFAFQMTVFVVKYLLIHLIAFYLALESLMTVGFKSGHYKLAIENTRKKSK